MRLSVFFGCLLGALLLGGLGFIGQAQEPTNEPVKIGDLWYIRVPSPKTLAGYSYQEVEPLIPRQFQPTSPGFTHRNDKTGKAFPRGLGGKIGDTPAARRAYWSKAPKWTPRAGDVTPSQYWRLPAKMSYWLNDQYGCCVTSQQAFQRACAGIWITDPTVLAWAQANGTLDGANLPPVAAAMAAKGFSQDSNLYGCGATDLAVDYASQITTCAAIAAAGQAGGCLQVGIAADELPSTAGNINGWFLTTNQPDSGEDHCVAFCGFGTAPQFLSAMNAAYPGLNLALPANVSTTDLGVALYTWSTIGWVDFACVGNMTSEAWYQSPPTVQTGNNPPQTVGVTVVTDPPVPPPPPPSPVNTMTLTIEGKTTNFSLSEPANNSVVLNINGITTRFVLTPIPEKKGLPR